MTMHFDRSAEDIGNVIHLEHVNLTIPDQSLATQFYISGLGLTRDPYLMTGVDNMWVNVGQTQFHLPQGNAQRLRGTVSLVIPDREALLNRLQRLSMPLQHTAFAFEPHSDCVEVRCPWGNRLRCFQPDADRFGAVTLGIVQIEFETLPNCAQGIALFYREVFGARATTTVKGEGLLAAHVQVGAGQTLVFSESLEALPSYDGHHIQIYVADFSGPHRCLHSLGLVSEESCQHQYRFLDITHPQTRVPLFRLEHEVRSMTHPLFGRPLVNRNPQQNNRHYRRGWDALVP